MSYKGNWASPFLRGFIKIINSVQFRHSVMSDSLWPHEPQHARLPVHHQLPEFTQTHVHRVGDAIQPSHPLSSPSPPALNPSQHQGLFQWVNSLNIPLVSLIFLKRSLVFPIPLFSSISLHWSLRKAFLSLLAGGYLKPNISLSTTLDQQNHLPQKLNWLLTHRWTWLSCGIVRCV